MLEGLDAVPWKTLQHAYGEASDVPGLIRRLASEDSDERDEALDALYGNICHQGTVYEATSRAVPFLVELFAAPAVKGREHIGELLFNISHGTSYHDVHQHLAFVGPILKEQPGFAERLAKELSDVEKVKAALSAVHPSFLAVLDADAEPAVRRQAVRLLSRCEGARAIVLRELQRRLFAVRDAPLRAAVHFALAALDFPGSRALLTDALGDESPLVRLAAALALGFFGAELPEAAARVLTEHLADLERADYAQFVFGSDQVADIGSALRQATPEQRERAADAMVAAVKAQRAGIFSVASPMLALVFDPQAPPKSLEALSPVQRRVLELVSGFTWTRPTGTWSVFANFCSMLRHYGLEELGERLAGYERPPRR